MHESQSQADIVDDLAEEFVARYRNGERPPVSEFAARCPERADEIRELFPALVVMEQAVREDTDEQRDSQQEQQLVLEQLGDFRIIREVGRGGMGIVYEAEQVSLGRRVALKLLPKQSLLDSKHQKRFLREAKAAARLHHTNIVPVFGVGQQDGLHYYVMQFIHGLGLDEVLVELQRQRELSGAGVECPELRVECGARDVSAVAVANSLMSGHFERTLLVDDESDQPSAVSDQPTATNPISRSTLNHKPSTAAHTDTVVGQLSDTFPGQSLHTSKHHSRHIYWQSVARIGSQAAQALQYAHDQGIIHRDIKPGNLLLDTRGSVWVTDFGLAKAADQQDLTHTGDVLGTLRYMAPEQFEGKADASSDVFSLGLTLYELLALKPAFGERDRHKLIKQVTTGSPARLRTLDPHIPRDLETIVHKAIDRDPSHRYQTADEMAADLQRYLGDEPIRARWVSPVTRFARWCKRNPAVAGLTSTIAALLVTAAIVSSVAAVRFENLAEEKTNLAAEKGDLVASLNEALGDATDEQERAEANLDLALEALDAVYLDAIGEEKLLGEPVSPTDSRSAETRVLPDLSELEKDLLRRGLTFYERFAEQNSATPQAAIQTAQANYRVGLLYAGLGEDDEAEAAYLAAIEKFETLAREQPGDVEIWRQLSESYHGYASSAKTWEVAQQRAEQLHERLSAAIVDNPDEPELYLLRGDVLCRPLWRGPTALRDYERALALGPTNFDSLIRSARKLHVEGGPYRAMQIQLAERAANLDEEGWAAQLSLGEAYGTALHKYLPGFEKPPVFVMDDPERALAHFNRAAELAPDRAEVFLRRAFFNYRRHYFDEAIADLDRAAELGASDPKLYGQILVWKGEHQRAQDVFQELLREDSSNFRAYEYLAVIAMREDRYQDAAELLTQALEDRTDGFWLLYRRATCFAELRDFARMVSDLEESLEMNPNDFTAFWLVSNSIWEECPDHLRDRWLEFCEQKTEQAVDRADAFACLGDMLAKHGEPERANRAFERSLALGESATLMHHWGRFFVAQEELERAREKFQRAIELKPGEWMIMRELGNVELRLKHWADARQRFDQVIQLADANVRSSDFWKRTMLSLMLDDRAAFQRSYQEMETRYRSTRSPSDANATAWTCSLIPQAVDDYTTAVDLARRANAADPDNDQYQKTLGAILFRAGRHDEALEQLTALADRLEQSDDVAGASPAYCWYYLAMAHHALGQSDDAGTWLNKANEWTEQVLTNDDEPPGWNRKLTLELLHDEANDLIDAESSN